MIELNNPNRILSGSRDKSIFVWDLTSKSEKRRTSLSGIETDVSVTNAKKRRLYSLSMCRVMASKY